MTDPPPRPPGWFRLWGPVIACVLVQVPVALWQALRASGLTTHGGRFPFLPDLPAGEAWLLLGLALLAPVALAFARRWPGPVVAVLAVAGSVDMAVGGEQHPPYLGLAFAIVSAVVRGARVWAWASIGACWLLATVSLIVFDAPAWTGGRAIGTTFAILVVFGIAEAIRSRRDRAAEYQRRLAEARRSEVQAERVRIAREIHDVLAHSLSQINVQAGVGLHLMDRQPDKAAEALASIKETSKTALDEVRSVLGALRADPGEPGVPLVPEPDLSRLPGLAASLAADGVAVDLDDRLPHAEVPQAVQLAIYRIVQESLTNVRRHATGARRVRVRLDRDDAGAAYRLEVADDGSAPAIATETGGRGLLGMRERAELLGGSLSAGPAPGGGFAVTAVIPSAPGGAP